MSQGPERFPIEAAIPFVPTLVYLAGAALALAGLALWPSRAGVALLTLTLGASTLGGWLATKLGAATAWGRELDSTLNVAVAAATAVACLGHERGPLAVLALAFVEALARYTGWRTGATREAVTVAALASHFA